MSRIRDVLWVHVEMLGPCLVHFVLCVFTFSSLWSHPLNRGTQYVMEWQTLYRTYRWDARRERAIPIRLDNFGLTGVVCWGAFQTQISDYIIVFVFDTFV